MCLSLAMVVKLFPSNAVLVPFALVFSMFFYKLFLGLGRVFGSLVGCVGITLRHGHYELRCSNTLTYSRAQQVSAGSQCVPAKLVLLSTLYLL